MVGRAEADGCASWPAGSISPLSTERRVYFAPMLLADVPPLHALAQDEIFGPVLGCDAFDTEAEAIALRQRHAYGLVAGFGLAMAAGRLRLAARSVRAGVRERLWCRWWRGAALRAE
jgi:acyl-CoA reductase-like NAD-dependent aldehyde dehydrogenase